MGNLRQEFVAVISSMVCITDGDCFNGGSCPVPGGSTPCTCPPAYTGDVCQTFIGCQSNGDCNNGGLCRNPNNTVCTCAGGHSGPLCDTPPATGNCTSDSDCLNGGTCPSLNVAPCTCVDDFTGSFCQVFPAVCNASCENGGNCTSGGICDCSSDYTGSTCAFGVVCSTDTDCQNDGTCVNGLCRCAAGFSGDTCETTSDPNVSQLATMTENASGNNAVGISITINEPFLPILGQATDKLTAAVSQSFQNTVNSLLNDNSMMTVTVGPFQFGGGSTIAVGIFTGTEKIDVNALSQIITRQVLTTNFSLPDEIGNIQAVQPIGSNLALKLDGRVVVVDTATIAANPWNCFTHSDCTNHGLCINGNCFCEVDYTGVNCTNQVMCANDDDCQNNGICSNSSCTCAAGYLGATCSISEVTCNDDTDCQNGGTCSSSSSCSCTTGSAGATCTIPAPSPASLLDASTTTVCSITMTSAIFVPALHNGSGCEWSFANGIKIQVEAKLPPGVTIGTVGCRPGSVIADLSLTGNNVTRPGLSSLATTLNTALNGQSLTLTYPDGSMVNTAVSSVSLTANVNRNPETFDLANVQSDPCLFYKLFQSCQNGGTCVDEDGNAICSCKTLVSGSYCEDDKRAVVASACIVIAVLLMGFLVFMALKARNAKYPKQRNDLYRKSEHRSYPSRRKNYYTRFPRRSRPISYMDHPSNSNGPISYQNRIDYNRRRAPYQDYAGNMSHALALSPNNYYNRKSRHHPPPAATYYTTSPPRQTRPLSSLNGLPHDRYDLEYRYM